MISDDELQSLREAAGWTEHISTLFLPATVLRLIHEIDRLKAENEKLTAELAAKERSLRIAEGYAEKLENAIRASIDESDKPILQPEEKT